MVNPLKKVLVKRLNTSWSNGKLPDLNVAQEEHDLFVSLLQQNGVEVIFADKNPNSYSAIYTHDPAIIINDGAIILRMANWWRQQEEAAIKEKFNELGIPIIYTIKEPGTAEGGDLLWIDEKTLAIGIGFRTNLNGFNQLKNIFESKGISVIPVDLPYYKGVSSCLHLQSLISLVDQKTAVVYLPLLPVTFINILHEKGFKLIEIPEQEFDTMGPNILTISPKVCITLNKNPITKKMLENIGCMVYTFEGQEMAVKGGGGATCLTRPILRD